MPAKFFVTGTDTGIGKTVVSTILARGLHAHYWKPVQTGTEEETDAEFLGQWIPNHKIHPSAYALPAPLSPHAAAAKEHIKIDFARIINQAPKAEPLVVEGAGGVLVPLNEEYLIIDLIQTLDLPAIVVSRSGLGTINHTLLTLQALRARKIRIAGVVQVGQPNESNKQAIEIYGRAPVIAQVDSCPRFSERWFDETFQTFELNHETN